MKSELFTALISILTAVCSGLIAWITYVIKAKHKEKEKAQRELETLKAREEKFKELLNYVMGAVDITLSDKVKMDPELRETLRCASSRYHTLDLTTNERTDYENK